MNYQCQDCVHWLRRRPGKLLGRCDHPSPQVAHWFRGIVKYGYESACSRDFQITTRLEKVGV